MNDVRRELRFKPSLGRPRPPAGLLSMAVCDCDGGAAFKMQRTAAIMPTKKTPASRPATAAPRCGWRDCTEGWREGRELAKIIKSFLLRRFPFFFIASSMRAASGRGSKVQARTFVRRWSSKICSRARALIPSPFPLSHHFYFPHRSQSDGVSARTPTPSQEIPTALQGDTKRLYPATPATDCDRKADFLRPFVRRARLQTATRSVAPLSLLPSPDSPKAVFLSLCSTSSSVSNPPSII